MNANKNRRQADVRVWVVAADAWDPESVFDEPRASTVLFPALDRVLTREEAAAFVAGFNEQMLAAGGRRWAIARRAAARKEEASSPAVHLAGEFGAGIGLADRGGASGQLTSW